MSKKKIVLIDAHALIHRAYHALPQFASSKGEPTGALYGLSTMLMRTLEELRPYAIYACFDLPKPTFRHVAYDAYKGTRQKSDDALVAQLIRAKDIFDVFHIPRFECEGFEADDLIGTLTYALKKQPDIEIIIVSGDMDTMQLITGDLVRVYTLKKGIQETQMYNEQKVFERYGLYPHQIPDYKGLAGDPSDNIPGIKGVGEKTATHLISSFGSLERLYQVLKKDSDELRRLGVKDRMISLLQEGEEEAFFSKTLATIRLDAPIQIPEINRPWVETFTPESASILFDQLEFRSLKPKVQSIVARYTNPKTDNTSNQSPASQKKESTLSKKVKKPEATYPTDSLFKEAQAILFLIDSDKTDPSLEDILLYTNTTDIQTAHKTLLSELARIPSIAWVYEHIDRPLIPIVASMERAGIQIDVRYFETLSKQYHEELHILEQDIWKSAGVEFLITSPKQLGDVLYDQLGLGKKIKKTAGGARSTNADMLESLQEEHPIIEKILHYREIQKLVSTYVDPLPRLIDSHDRIHTHFLHTGAATGRFASRDPNLQNIPIKTDAGMAIRKGFIAREGFVLLSCDYSQIELRVAAILSQDQFLLETFQRGEDSHASVASRVFGVSVDQVTKEQRRIAKVLNFGVLYGMGVNALKDTLGSDRASAQAFYDTYKQTFPTLMAYLDDVKMQAKKNGYTETLFGRRRQLKMMRSPLPFIRAQGERMAINAPIQGTSADIMRLALLDITTRLQDENMDTYIVPLLQIHDECIFEVQKGHEEQAKNIVVSVMEHVLEKHKKESAIIPLLVSADVGDTWADI